MSDPRKRTDVSKFLIHLTRSVGGFNAEDNLINILQTKTIEARNHHCLFSPKLKNMDSTNRLKESFSTVCFTETPLDQIHKLAAENFPRKVKLKPYGLVFWREDMVNLGVNPAIYLNGYSTSLKSYLLSEFNRHFKDINALKRFRQKEQYYKEIIHYYSLVNLMNDKHDFSWEREWRHNGDFRFKYRNIVAIVAKDPAKFLKACAGKLTKIQMNYIKRIPIICSTWSYEDVVEEMAIKIWETNGK